MASDIPATSEVILQIDSSRQFLDTFIGKRWDAWGEGLGGENAAELMLQLFRAFNLAGLACISALFIWVIAIAVRELLMKAPPLAKGIKRDQNDYQFWQK